jgi:glyoxylase-like metal-dependent hydrolase (beta-lactamase superfamily II)
VPEADAAGHVRAQPLGDGAWLLDTQFAGRPATIGVYLVPHAGDAGRAGRFDLVEAAPAVSHDAVVAAISAAGFAPEGLDTVIVTHVHLDHAAGAGTWSVRYGARVVAHERGVPHLADPSRLLASARRVYGDALEALWGAMVPVPLERLVAVRDGDDLVVGGRRVRAIHTPGHASHHAAFLWPDGVLYVGDAAGVQLPGSTVIRPALPPPETDLEAWDETLARLAALAPTRLRLTHFGEVRRAREHLAEVGRRNHEWAEVVLGFFAEGSDDADAARRLDELARAELASAGADAATVERNLLTSDATMTVAALARYWRTKHPIRWREAVGG